MSAKYNQAENAVITEAILEVLEQDKPLAARIIAERVNNIADKAKELAEALGRKVTKEELAEETEIDVEDIAEAIRFSAGQIEYLETDN